VAATVSAGLLILVLELVRRRKLTDEHSLIWVLCAGTLLGFSLWRDALHRAAALLGVHYPPAVLILALIFFAFVVSLYFSVVVSRQRRQIEQLIEDLALVEADIRQLRSRAGTIPPEDVIPGAARYGREPGDHRRVG
jgi:hypothetical protein